MRPYETGEGSPNELKEPVKFSEYFGIPRGTNLGFVDIYTSQDIPLFLDPFGIAAMGTSWAQECESQIATYFQYLVDSIRTGDKRTIKSLLGALHEVNEIALGYSLGEPSGRGIGVKQAEEIQFAFENSQAAQSGDIKDLADCALMIPGISRDKISDITANLLKKQLVGFTQEQCRKFGIPMMEVPINNVFDYERFIFVSYFGELPVINGKPKILLPKSAVRQDPQLSKDKYYRKYVLEFLKAEHGHAGDSLATVLKNGKVVVRINDLKKKYPLGSDFLYEFSKAHPSILEKYKSELRRSALESNSISKLETKRKILSADDRSRILSDIKPGNAEAHAFHKISFDNLIHIFGDRLSNPQSEKSINEGRKRIDIVFENSDDSGFFSSLNFRYNIQCPKVFVECKNYGNRLGNPEVDQILGRFSAVRGKFGLLVCRSVGDRDLMLKRCKDAVHDGRGFVVVLEDLDIIQLLNFREENDQIAIDRFMQSKFDELIM